MPLKPPRYGGDFSNSAKMDRWARATPVTPDANSVDTGQIAGATTAANNRFYVKRSGAMTFDTVQDTDLPATIARDTEVTAAANAAQAAAEATAAAALAAHEAAPDPHPQYLLTAEGDVRYPLASNILNGSATYDPPSLADGVGATTTVSVTGAALGDFALASFSLDLQGILVTAYVSAANTVSVRFQNETTGTIDLGSGTLKARVWK